MKDYIYPAVFTAESEGVYSVNFPDLKNCYTCGDDLADAFEMAKDVLSLTKTSHTITVCKSLKTL